MGYITQLYRVVSTKTFKTTSQSSSRFTEESFATKHHQREKTYSDGDYERSVCIPLFRVWCKEMKYLSNA